MNAKWTISMFFALAAVPSLAAAAPVMSGCVGDSGNATLVSLSEDVAIAARLAANPYGLNVTTASAEERRAYRKLTDAGTYVPLEAAPAGLGDWRLYPAIDISPRLMIHEGTHEDIYVLDGVVYLHSWSDQALETLPGGWFRID